MTKQQHGVEIVYQTKKGISNNQTYVSINSNHKATTTWESSSKYVNNN